MHPLQNFLYEHGLQNKPIVAMGISAGASFAVKVGRPCWVPSHWSRAWAASSCCTWGGSARVSAVSKVACSCVTLASNLHPPCPPAPGCIEQLPKAFYDANFGDIIKMQGVISGRQQSLRQLRQVVQRTVVHGAKQMLLHCLLRSCSAPQAHSLRLPTCPPTEVNAIEWQSWGLVNRNGKFRFPGFPPVAFLSMLVRVLLLPLFPNFPSAPLCVMPVSYLPLGRCGQQLMVSTPDAEAWGEVQPAVHAQQPQGRLLAHALSLTPPHSSPADRNPQKDTKTHTLVMDSILRLRYFGVPSDYVPVSCGSTEALGPALACWCWGDLPAAASHRGASQAAQRCTSAAAELACCCMQQAHLSSSVISDTLSWLILSLQIQERLVTPTWFSDRSPTITARQSLEIVNAMCAALPSLAHLLLLCCCYTPSRSCCGWCCHARMSHAAGLLVLHCLPPPAALGQHASLLCSADVTHSLRRVVTLSCALTPHCCCVSRPAGSSLGSSMPMAAWPPTRVSARG